MQHLVVFQYNFATTHLGYELQELGVLKLGVCILAERLCQGFGLLERMRIRGRA